MTVPMTISTMIAHTVEKAMTRKATERGPKFTDRDAFFGRGS
jgi:hypothetical protein